MNAELKTKWLTALRSGAFKQGTGALKLTRDGITKHCCLGVLCEVAGIPLVESKTLVQELAAKYCEDNDTSSYLGNNALMVTGLLNNTQRTLATMNDEGKPFSVIADYIEANL